ncbi:MAG TPA: universal stress protein [Dokdonella sp.]|uniref:universal stress protein n=1 Tax=Dokdonella sp. TaxID=2291710 RepID=UPI0025BEBE46|nr:universal stress protein [Dokdonella sp.]MBX3691647.1 universal stress protein [Dokdonella sp.]MCW5568276.1 universal stress protein [Dokdonella sp.]HNR91707.1 universal stress protein [Dokdonella sp.]
MNPAFTAPPRVILSTDRSARCDRALARATRLAGEFGAEAVAVSVVEKSSALAEEVAAMQDPPSWYHAPSARVRAERELHRELAATGIAWRMQVVDDDDDGRWRATFEHEAARADTMIVCGPMREGVLNPVRLGSILDRLLRMPAARVLIVRQPAHQAYRHVVVATDFSAPSKVALQAARALAPQARLTLLHAFEVPRLGFDADSRDEAVARARLRLQDEARAFVDDLGEVEVVVEHGDPVRLVRMYCDTFDPDLVACGTHGHGALYELVIGSVARGIALRSSIDTLLVHA